MDMKKIILATLSILLLVIVLVTQEYITMIIVCLFVAPICAIYLYLFLIAYKYHVSRKRSLEYSGQNIFIKDKHENILESIDIEKPYTLKYSSLLYYPDAIFQIFQGNRKLEFTTQTENAEFILKEILGLKGEYPPDLKHIILF